MRLLKPEGLKKPKLSKLNLFFLPRHYAEKREYSVIN
jgi:hypothetical protein